MSQLTSVPSCVESGELMLIAWLPQDTAERQKEADAAVGERDRLSALLVRRNEELARATEKVHGFAAVSPRWHTRLSAVILHATGSDHGRSSARILHECLHVPWTGAAAAVGAQPRGGAVS